MSAIQNISLYIPHIYANYTSGRVFDIIENMRIGEVKRVDFVPKTGSDGKPYNAAYIHFYQWYDNIVAHNFQERVLNPAQEARIMYDDPWYWIVLENKTKKHVPGERKPRIDLDAFNGSIVNHKPTAGFDCGHTPAKTKSEEEAKPTNYLTPKQFKKAAMDVIYAPKKAKTWANVVQPAPTPVKLENVFNAEAQAADNEITEEEMDWAYEQMEDDQMLAYMEAEMEDRHYVESLEEECEMLRSQLAYFQNLYYTETIKSQTLADTIKNLKE
jgi:hypothetical protein